MIKAVIIQIFGRVQGVGFRYYTVRKAMELGVYGFVQNKGDGSVYIEAEGRDDTLNLFINWCYKGPQWANVRDVIVSEMPSLGRTTFQIK